MRALLDFSISTQQSLVKRFVFQIRFFGKPARLLIHLAGHGNAGPEVLKVAGPGVVRAGVQHRFGLGNQRPVQHVAQVIQPHLTAVGPGQNPPADCVVVPANFEFNEMQSMPVYNRVAIR